MHVPTPNEEEPMRLIAVTSLAVCGLALSQVADAGPTPPAPATGEGPLSPAPPSASLPEPVTLVAVYHGRTAEEWAARSAQKTRQLQHVRRQLRQRWRPTVDYAIRLASAVTGVSSRDMSAVAKCESHLFPFASNGRYKGVFQLGWAPFGFSPYDPIANALSAAMTVAKDGGWRQWECKP
jgi:hypothetical protein